MMWLNELYPHVAEAVKSGSVPLVIRLPGRADVTLRIDGTEGAVVVGDRHYADLQQAVDAAARDVAGSSTGAAPMPPAFDAWDVVHVCHPGLPAYSMRHHRLSRSEQRLNALLKQNRDRLPQQTRDLVKMLARPRDAVFTDILGRGVVLLNQETVRRPPLAADLCAYEKLAAT